MEFRALTIAILMLASAACAQSVPRMAADANPGFDVATIKPSRPDESRLFQVQGTRLATTDTSLVDLMMFAYSVHQLQITGGPDWIRTDKFDVLFQADLPGRPSTAQMRIILQKLLADRFKLTLHHAQKVLPIFRIVVTKGGFKATPTTADEAANNTAAFGFGAGAMTVVNATLPEFASLMQRYVGFERPLVDSTGITGKYDFKLKWAPDPSQFDGRSPFPPAKDADALPSFYTAIQEQLGLKFQPTRASTDVLVIDRVEKPSDN